MHVEKNIPLTAVLHATETMLCGTDRHEDPLHVRKWDGRSAVLTNTNLADRRDESGTPASSVVLLSSGKHAVPKSPYELANERNVSTL